MISKKTYQEYLRSNWWQTRRQSRLKLADNRCEYRPPIHWYKDDYLRGERCIKTCDLEMHHLHYETLGYEIDEDLEVLCRKHHLLRCLMDVKCEFCGSEIFDEEYALALIDGTYESFDPSPRKMTFEDVLGEVSWGHTVGINWVCQGCDHMLNKED